MQNTIKYDTITQSTCNQTRSSWFFCNDNPSREVRQLLIKYISHAIACVLLYKDVY